MTTKLAKKIAKAIKKLAKVAYLNKAKFYELNSKGKPVL
jgi:hypothetical protein